MELAELCHSVSGSPGIEEASSAVGEEDSAVGSPRGMQLTLYRLVPFL